MIKEFHGVNFKIKIDLVNWIEYIIKLFYAFFDEKKIETIQKELTWFRQYSKTRFQLQLERSFCGK